MLQAVPFTVIEVSLVLKSVMLGRKRSRSQSDLAARALTDSEQVLENKKETIMSDEQS